MELATVNALPVPEILKTKQHFEVLDGLKRDCGFSGGDLPLHGVRCSRPKRQTVRELRTCLSGCFEQSFLLPVSPGG